MLCQAKCILMTKTSIVISCFKTCGCVILYTWVGDSVVVFKGKCGKFCWKMEECKKAISLDKLDLLAVFKINAIWLNNKLD